MVILACESHLSLWPDLFQMHGILAGSVDLGKGEQMSLVGETISVPVLMSVLAVLYINPVMPWHSGSTVKGLYIHSWAMSKDTFVIDSVYHISRS